MADTVFLRDMVNEKMLREIENPCSHDEYIGLMVSNQVGPGVVSSAWKWCPTCGSLSSDGTAWRAPSMGPSCKGSR